MRFWMGWCPRKRYSKIVFRLFRNDLWISFCSMKAMKVNGFHLRVGHLDLSLTKKVAVPL